MALKYDEKVANAMFAIKTFNSLKEGGIWAGDEFTFKKVGKYFYAMDKKSFEYAKKALDGLAIVMMFDLKNPIYKAPVKKA